MFVDSQTLIVRMEEPEEDALFVVSQVSSDYVVLSSTEPVKYQSGG